MTLIPMSITGKREEKTRLFSYYHIFEISQDYLKFPSTVSCTEGYRMI